MDMIQDLNDESHDAHTLISQILQGDKTCRIDAHNIQSIM